MTIFYGGQAHVFDDVHPNKVCFLVICTCYIGKVFNVIGVSITFYVEALLLLVLS